jgi:hypothetical protein
MANTTRRQKGLLRWALPWMLVAGAYACGSSGDDDGGTNGAGSPCASNSDCASGVCDNGECVGSGPGTGGSSGSTGKPGGSPCNAGDECASGTCDNGTCTGAPGTGGTGTGGTGTGGTGTGGTSAGGAGGTAGGGGIGGTPGPHWPGSGNGFRPLTPGCGPETADQCTGTCEKANGTPGVDVVRPPATLCFAGTGDATPDDPAVVIEQVIEKLNGKYYVHIRITFDPAFTDNTYGAGSCCGWPPKRGHRFGDLTGSDHTELQLTDAEGNVVMNFKIDFITADPNSPCGFGTLGVAGGDGSMITGDPAHVLAVASSLDRNLNGCGYCKNAACSPSGDCTVDSPATDENYTANPGTPDWDYRQVYEVWIDMAAFGDPGFGQAFITYTHSSPAKSTDTITVEPEPCPPEWDKPYCPPGVVQEGGNCSPGSGGAGGSGGDGGTPCPPNFQVYVTSEGASICTPIPFANYPNHAPCPDGYVLDVATEGQYCVPAN